jgi:hypothetical protein
MLQDPVLAQDPLPLPSKMLYPFTFRHFSDKRMSPEIGPSPKNA